MKKTWKKLTALAVAMMMVLAMSVPVLAEEAPAGGYSVTITQNVKDTGAHTYGAYKIFKGTLDDGVLSDLAWADGLTIGDDVAGKIQTALGLASAADAKDAEKVAAALDTLAFDADKAKAFADAIAPALTSAEKTASGTGDVTIEGLSGGYYMIKDTTNPTVTEGQYASQTRFILKVTKLTNTVEVKSSVPSIQKNVKDRDDTAVTETGWQDAADHDLDDVINYQLTISLGDGIQNYKEYYLEMKDTMSDGLAYQSDIAAVLDVDGNAATTDDQYELTTITSAAPVAGTIKAADGTTELTAKVYSFVIEDLFAETEVTADVKAALTASSKIFATYTAKLTGEKVVYGSNGNPNDVSLIYASNPNWTGEGKPTDTEETPKDRNIVFTYKAIVNKKQPNPEYKSAEETPEEAEYIDLTGANFTLYKVVGANYVAKTGETILTGAEVKAANPKSKMDDIADETKYVAIASTGTDPQFEFKGLDDGDYVLVETTIPEGFNAFASIAFTLAAEHDETNADDPQLKKLMGATEGEVTLVGTQKATVDLAAGSIATDIVNEKGVQLPSTGGIGTTIFYVLGAILVLGGTVVLVTRRRMAA